jgi:hypothetical protein
MNHLGSLRVSLLLAIGIVPVACGGTVQRGDDGGAGADAGTGSTPNTGSGGSSSKAGTSNRAGGPGKMLPPIGGTDAGGTGFGGSPTRCSNPQVDPLTGLVGCSEGYTHRPTVPVCSPFGGAGPGEGEGGASNEAPLKPLANGTVECGDFSLGGAGSGGDCDQFELGYCAYSEIADEESAYCESGCYEDADCSKGLLCECGHAESPSGGVCVTARCRTDSECASGLFCTSSNGICGGHEWSCQTPQDECLSDRDCGGGTCTSDGFEYRTCDDAVCGRPFLVEATARVAPVVPSDAWRDDTTPSVQHLTSVQRRALAEHWTHLGQMEHASIAAFARFQLQLLALGAPPELVEQCTRALADETAHTKLCFGIASSYAGCAIGPGPLDVSGSLELTSLADIVELVIVEGCLGETRAALDARSAADATEDPVIAAAYARIATDEQRHAELAFRFVRWALEHDAATVRDSVARALVSLPADVAAQGVTRPCLQALLELTPPALAAARAPANLPVI